MSRVDAQEEAVAKACFGLGVYVCRATTFPTGERPPRSAKASKRSAREPPFTMRKEGLSLTNGVRHFKSVWETVNFVAVPPTHSTRLLTMLTKLNQTNTD